MYSNPHDHNASLVISFLAAAADASTSNLTEVYSHAADRVEELVKHDLTSDGRRLIRCAGWRTAEDGRVQGRRLTISSGFSTVTTIRSYGWPARSRITAGRCPWQTAKVTLSLFRTVPTRITPGSPVPVVFP
jgi:hypothetical protein